MQKVVITGSEGFVGQHLVNLLKKDYQIIGLSRNTQIPSAENVNYVLGDILNPDQMYDLLKTHQPDTIIHLAGIAKTWGIDPKELFNINLFGTLNIYEAVLKLKAEQSYDPKIIFISSAEVYGKTTNLDNITEDAPLLPINPYGTSKLAADRLSYQYSQASNLKIAILRPFPHIGPGQQKGFFVPDMASQIVEIEKGQTDEILVGNLQAVRDYLDVRDVVQAYKAIMESDFTPGEVFNICSGHGVAIKDLLDKLLSTSQKQINIKEDPTRLRPVDLPTFVGNNEKLVKATGWSPKLSIDATLKDVLDYWRGKS
ncbi:MAG: GDP-mannose 4,6-dehydratase [Candidatus Daviesbacteria bacterium]|nr:GDP-mannose 4,6-dehydratase [Candidatus Daviesbacteria bacterium]